MKTIYVAGCMRGIKWFNFSQFDEARDDLRRMGWNVISPADLDRAAGLDPFSLPDDWDWSIVPPEFDLLEAIERDIDAILHHADAIYLLPGWERSSGAQWEYALAKVRGLEVYRSIEPCLK